MKGIEKVENKADWMKSERDIQQVIVRELLPAGNYI